MSEHKCPSCDESFDTAGGMKLHHYHSHGESIAKEETTCNICGTEFKFYPCDKDGLYCSSCVENEDWRHIPEPKYGEDSPVYNTVPVECEECGETIYKTKSSADKWSRNFCDNECYGEWRSDYQIGEDNPNFVDGRTEDELYKGKWSKNRKKALQRDGYKCVNCQKTKEEIGKNPDVHHIIPIREFDNIDKGHKLENLVSLCRSCHTLAERNEISVSGGV